MRLLLALVFAAVGLVFVLVVGFTLRLQGGIATLFLATFTVASFVLAFVIVDKILPAPRPPSLAELDALGRLRRLDFRVLRGFGVEEYEDEGPHYFLELEDNRVLYLNGQYLYDYEPDARSTESGHPRRFPCTEFALIQDNEKGWTLDIECRGSVIEPEFIARHPRHWPPEFDDGQTIVDESYDQLRSRFHSAGAA